MSLIKITTFAASIKSNEHTYIFRLFYARYPRMVQLKECCRLFADENECGIFSFTVGKVMFSLPLTRCKSAGMQTKLSYSVIAMFNFLMDAKHEWVKRQNWRTLDEPTAATITNCFKLSSRNSARSYYLTLDLPFITAWPLGLIPTNEAV